MSSSVWYILRTFNCQELKLSQFLTENGCPHFIPMMYAEKPDRQGRAHRVLLPVVHNPCPADGHTKRQEVKALIHTLSATYPDLREKVFSAMRGQRALRVRA